MDVNDLRITVTLVSLLLFLALVVHTFSRRRKAAFDEAAWLPFAGDSEATDGPAAEGAPAGTPARAPAPNAKRAPRRAAP